MKKHFLNIATVGQGFSILGSLDVFPRIEHYQSDEDGTPCNTATLSPDGMDALLNEVAGYVEQRICVDLLMRPETATRLISALKSYEEE